MNTTQEVLTMNVADVVYREDLYPRIKPDAATIQRYAENLDVLPPIEVNQHNILIDGFHRWTGHRKAEAQTIKAIVIETKSEQELFALAIEKNAAHGLQMNDSDKKQVAIRLYGAGTGLSKQEIGKVLSVTPQSVNRYLNDIEKDLREKRKERIREMWMNCATLEEIAEATGIEKMTVSRQLEECNNLNTCSNSYKVSANFQEEGFSPPLYNVWTFAKKTNEVSHFGNSEQRIVDNLLYLYTQPFDIVLDPFAGGGSTIDVCRKRLRRCFASDRKPIVERENEIRKLDIAHELPQLNKRWSEVSLTYFDPPYWKQAENQYSKDAEDLANMPLDEFTEAITGIVRRVAEKQSRGAIALIIQPTQWKAEGREFTDHVFDIVSAVSKSKNLTLENRVSCPYSTEQCLPQQVDWAKSNRKLLVISRELIIWRF